MKELADKLKLSLKELADFFYMSPGAFRVMLHRGQWLPAEIRPVKYVLHAYKASIQPNDLEEIEQEYNQLHSEQVAAHQQEALEKVKAALYQAKHQLKRLEEQREYAFRRRHMHRNLEKFMDDIPDDAPKGEEKLHITRQDMLLLAGLYANTAQTNYKDNFAYDKYWSLKQKIVGLEAEQAFLESQMNG